MDHRAARGREVTAASAGRACGHRPISSMGRHRRVPARFGASAPASSSTAKRKHEKRCADLVEKGVDGIKLFERLKPQVAKAAVDEAHKLGRPVFGHSLDIFTAAANGYQSVEHSWSVVYTSIQDPKKKTRSRHRAHARQSRYRRRARANGAGDVRQDHQGDGREKRPLESRPGRLGSGRCRATPPR